MLALHDWQNFYMLAGTVSATLIGLLFVAISIGHSIPGGKLAQWLMFFAFKDGILYRRVGINQEDAWETASGAANSEAFLVIPGTLNASRMSLQVRTVLPGRACVQIFSVKFVGSGNAFEHSVPNLQRIMGTELTKMADGDPLLEWLFQAAMRQVPSFSENSHL